MNEKGFFSKYWLVILIVALVIVYFLFKEKIDGYLGIAKGLITPSGYSCRSTFYAKTEGKTFNVWTSDEGTPASPNVKYYRQEVNLTESGVENVGLAEELTKSSFQSLCKYLFNPPYAWYTAESPTMGIPHTTRPTYRAGGVVGGGGGSTVVSIGGTPSGLQTVVGASAPLLYDKDGNPVNAPYGAKPMTCPKHLLVPYPAGHPYYGYYYCGGGSGSI